MASLIVGFWSALLVVLTNSQTTLIAQGSSLSGNNWTVTNNPSTSITNTPNTPPYQTVKIPTSTSCSFEMKYNFYGSPATVSVFP